MQANKLTKTMEIKIYRWTKRACKKHYPPIETRKNTKKEKKKVGKLQAQSKMQK